MNDLQALRDLGTALDADHSAPVAEIRGRVMAGSWAASNGSITPGARPSTRRPAVPRFGWRIAVAGGLAAAVAVGAFTLPLSDADRNSPPGGTATDPALATAGDLLRLAAHTAATEPELAPRPDQFILIESTVSDMVAAKAAQPGPAVPPGPGPARLPPGPAITQHMQEWRSADGTRDGLIRGGDGSSVRMPGCVNGMETAVAEDDHPQACQVMPGYLKDLPTDAEAMRAHLGRIAADYRLATTGAAVRLLFQGYLPPPARAALFEALAGIPGSVVVDDITDAAGRHGTAVTYTDDGLRVALIFDPTSYAFLGARTDVVVVDNPLGLPVGATPWSHAIDRIAVVDQAGRLPN